MFVIFAGLLARRARCLYGEMDSIGPGRVSRGER